MPYTKIIFLIGAFDVTPNRIYVGSETSLSGPYFTSYKVDYENY